MDKNKKTITIIAIVIIAILIILGIVLLANKPAKAPIPSPSEEMTPEFSEEPLSAENSLDSSFFECFDPVCLQSQFLGCNRSRLTMPFNEGNTFVVTVYGATEGKCHYVSQVVNENNVALQSTDCNVPLENISSDIINHLFGNEDEAAKAEQDQLEATYCVKQ